MTVSALTRPGERRRLVVKLSEIDWTFCAAITVIAVAGGAMLYSVAGGEWKPWAAQHLIRYGLWFVVMIALATLDLQVWFALAYPVYAVGLVLLVAVAAHGHSSLGARRWLDFGPIHQFQPSEVMKIGLVLALARFYHSLSGRRAKLSWWLLIPALLIAMPVALVMKQPDLGTAVTLLPVFFGVAYLAGLRMRLLGIIAIACLPLGLFAYKFALKDYQRQRIETFLDPSQDPRGAGYQTIQARVTVGSGGLTGKGFRQGTQGALKYLPVAHNDFIFSVLAEEQGFIGVLAALGLYLFVILRSIEAARLAKDRLGAYLVGGIISGFAFQVIYNVTMSAGLAPVKGITLPLMSYGGSSLIASLAGFGLILNVRMRRFTN